MSAYYELFRTSGVWHPYYCIETEQHLVDKNAEGLRALADEIEKGLADGTFSRVDDTPFDDAENIINDLIDEYGEEAINSITPSESAFIRLNEIYYEFDAIVADENASQIEYADDIARLAEDLTQVYADLEKCLNGTHNVMIWTDNTENHIGDCTFCIATGITADHTDEDSDKLCDDCQAEIIDTCPDCGRPVHGDSLIEKIFCWFVMLINLIKSIFA